MRNVLIAEYDAAENALRLAEPLAGVNDHEKVCLSIEAPPADESRPWLKLRGSLSPEAGDSLARAIEAMFGPSHWPIVSPSIQVSSPTTSAQNRKPNRIPQ